MLYFEDNKTSRKALPKLLDGILDFLGMCEPGCQLPIFLFARTYDPDGLLGSPLFP